VDREGEVNETLYTKCVAGQIDDALDLLLATVEEWTDLGEYDRCRTLLNTLDLTRVDDSIGIALLGALRWTPSVSVLVFAKRLRTHLATRHSAADVDAMLRGLT
jgi:hypothetical protein